MGKGNKAAPNHGHWGGYEDDFGPAWFQVVMISCSPLAVLYILFSGQHFDFGWVKLSSFEQFLSLVPSYTWDAFIAVVGWYIFQAALYVFLPGPISKGPVTPAGNVQDYKLNSIHAWFVSVFCFAGIYFSPLSNTIRLSYLSSHLPEVIWMCNVFGFLLSVVFYLKALYFPTNSDCAMRPSFVQNFFLGCELSPRLGKHFDLKLYMIGHVAMIAWTIINLAHAVRQYELFGYVSASMILVNVFHAIYTVDWAVKEHWYLYTIDMRHDRLGWYLTWGPATFLPATYCLQGWYLSKFPVEMSPVAVVAVLVLNCFGYFLFRASNDQKDYFRDTMKKTGQCLIWGRPAVYIKAAYSTGNGESHTSLLLASGYWGLSRHFNYVADLIMCLCFSLPCGFDSIFPYFYLFYMAALLTHRAWRDDRKCRAKYGKHWDEYCKKVPYLMFPYIY